MVPPSLGFARIRLRAAAPAIVEEAGRHASRLTGGAPRRAPAADGDAVAVEDQRAMGSRRANAATTRSSAAHRPFSGRSSVVSWLRRRTPAFYASREAVRGHVTCWATSRSRTSCPALARPTPLRPPLRGGASHEAAGRGAVRGAAVWADLVPGEAEDLMLAPAGVGPRSTNCSARGQPAFGNRPTRISSGGSSSCTACCRANG